MVALVLTATLLSNQKWLGAFNYWEDFILLLILPKNREVYTVNSWDAD